MGPLLPGAIHWHKVADNIAAINWNTENLSVFSIGERQLLLAKVNGKVYACTNRCPHASGAFSQGFLDAQGNIVCPLHKYKFSLQNGLNVTGEGYRLKIYAVEERPSGIFVGIQEQGLSVLPEIG
ncbi:(2Fe-2S)-binding protein [Segetibacter sp. 3557_3]|uniref:Rieske (2Fe-2S) protein n=1 Tax=Segetibacter sp. 3557_3 TaxID=2547429 RepID=UPI001058C0A1|nr:Rieske 2Fe-2S domain-containing protein [Segetibacter sp. 3557_3]TDH20692.1 (2Fe-2S)-binding protein [Segetibacter sp. 3557_3]